MTTKFTAVYAATLVLMVAPFIVLAMVAFTFMWR